MRSGEIFKGGWWLCVCGGGGGDLFAFLYFFFIFLFFCFLSRYWAKCPWAEEPHKSPSPLIWSQRGQTTTHGSKHTCGNANRNGKMWQVSTDRNWTDAIRRRTCKQSNDTRHSEEVCLLRQSFLWTGFLPLNSNINHMLRHWHSQQNVSDAAVDCHQLIPLRCLTFHFISTDVRKVRLKNEKCKYNSRKPEA